MTDKYAVIGNPINHSMSPLIHNLFGKQLGQDIDYSAIELPLDSLRDNLIKLRDINQLKAANITVPFKEQAWHLVDKKSKSAELAGAVNIINFNDDGSLFGENTDGVGLCRDLIQNHQITLRDKRILLLGAGGAARGAIAPLLSFQPSSLFVANRTVSKAVNLAEMFANLGNIQGGGYDSITSEYDLIINATTTSLQGSIPPVSTKALTKSTACYDMMYSSSDTAFVSWAKQQQAAKAIDGLGMLVEQAAESFRLWRGVKPDTQAVIEQLRNQ